MPPVGADNKREDGYWYDEGRLEKIPGKKIMSREVSADENGCDMAPTGGRREGML